MKTNLYVHRSRFDIVLFGDLPTVPDARTLVGYINVVGGDNPSWLYQTDLVECRWCASQWDTIPPDSVWRIRGVFETLYTNVRSESLDFRNTPLEHRYNLSVRWKIFKRFAMNERSLCSSYIYTLELLAHRERLLWKDGTTFIPFKEINPQGYRGVWINTNIQYKAIDEVLTVRDSFEDGHRLEVLNV